MKNKKKAQALRLTYLQSGKRVKSLECKRIMLDEDVLIIQGDDFVMCLDREIVTVIEELEQERHPQGGSNAWVMPD